MLERPDKNEYDPFYDNYIGQAPDGDLLAIMASELDVLLDLLRLVDPERETYRYAADKWSIRELVGHLIDSERLFAYRALSFARGDGGPLPGMDQHQWVEESNVNERSLGELLSEFEHLRRSHIAMFGSFDEATGMRRGVASDCSFTVRALAYIVAGHEIHHRKVLQERYLGS